VKAFFGMDWWKAVSKTPIWGTSGPITVVQALMPVMLAGLWSGARGVQSFSCLHDVRVDPDASRKSLAAVDDPVADSVYFFHALNHAVIGACQFIDDG
jgi:hypothetical protein